MKKIMISITILFIISGCYNYNELNNYSIATGMSVDLTENNNYLVSFLISNEKKEKSNEDNSQYPKVLYSGEGKTVYEAIKNIDLISPKQLYIGHLNTIIISEDVAALGLYDSLEFLIEDSQSKKNFYVVLAKGNKAKDILSITTPINNSSSQGVFENIESSYKLEGNIIAKTFNDVIYELINDGIETSIASYIIVEDTKDGSTLKNLESTEPNSYIKLDSLGIFKDDKLVTWADKEIAKGINIINNDIKELNITISCNNGNIAVNTSNIKTNINVSKSKVDINTKGVASIREVTCDIDLENVKNLNELQNKVNKQIESLIDNSFKFAQAYESDVFGLGLYFYRNNLSEYKKSNWNHVFKTITPNISVDIKIKNNGALKQSLERISNE